MNNIHEFPIKFPPTGDALTLEKLKEIQVSIKTYPKRMVILPSPFIPEDAYGILFVRPNDAEKWKE